MAVVAAGEFKPMFAGKEADQSIPVRAFEIDVVPVTNADFLEFVKANPTWRRSLKKRLFADGSYLASWAGDLDLGSLDPQAPVTQVSWFAAKAYAKWLGKRLPTLAEWELAAGLTGAGPEMTRKILDWYGQPTPKTFPAVGQGAPNQSGLYDLHGLVWEWVLDFNTAMVTGESRGDSALERNLYCGAGAVGAANPNDYAAFMRYAFRAALKADYAIKNLGFRCVRDLP